MVVNDTRGSVSQTSKKIQIKDLLSKARRVAACSKSPFRKVIGPGSRAMHILAGIRDGKISRDDLGVATPLPEIVFVVWGGIFLKEPRGERFVSLENKGDAYSFGRKSILRWSTLHNLSFTSFFRQPPPLSKHVPGPPACVKVYN